MSVLSKSYVPSAAVNRSKLDVSQTHVTTGEFLQCQVAGYRHMLPKEHIKGNVFVNARLAPLAVPTYGRCRINVRNFFVPFRQVFPNVNEFLTNSIANNFDESSLVEYSPHYYNSDLVNMFMGDIVDSTVTVDDNTYTILELTPINPFNEELVHVVGTRDSNTLHWISSEGAIVDDDSYDFIFVDDSISLVARCRFSNIGRHLYRTLISLGYRVVWNSKYSKTPISALALLSYAKVYCDWYFNQNYADAFEYQVLQRLFKFNDPSSALVLDSDSLFYLLRLTHFVLYDGANDYITNAWDSPMAPNAGNQLPLSISDITDSGNTSVRMTADYTPYMSQNDPDNNGADIGTAFIHQALKAMTDFVKRHQLTSAIASERFLAEYGIQLDSASSNRSIFISTHSQDVNFDAVYSTADTAGADEASNLGDYSGRGVSQGNDEIDFTADEFGIFISIASILPMAGYYQTFDRNNLHVTPSDFFINEYDNLGCQAVSKAEVYVSDNGEFGSFDDYMGVFGYAPRLCEYKVGRSLVSGDFILGSRFAGGDSWNLFRKLSDSNFSDDIDNLVHSLNFTRGIDYNQYNRIFQDTNTSNDKFYLVFHFALSSDAPCKSLFESYDFEENGKKLLFNSNGPKVN